MRKLRLSFFMVIFFGLLLPFINAQTYKIIVGDIPGTENIVKMMQIMSEEMKVKLNFETVPMARMVYMLENKQADFGMPMLMLKNKEIIDKLPFDYSKAVFQKMPFVLYTNKSKPIDIVSIKKGNSKNYKIESDISNMNLFNFTALSSTSVEGSLKKVNEGRIDGYIMGQITGDIVLKSLNLKNIKRQLFETYDIGWALQKGGKGGPVDKFLSEGFRKVKTSRKCEEILSELKKREIYDDWQP